MLKACVAIAACTLGAGQALAQDAYGNDYGIYRNDYNEAYVETPTYSVPPAELAEDLGLAPGPRVYGWRMEEASPDECGTFQYWNGDYCADARYQPPGN